MGHETEALDIFLSEDESQVRNLADKLNEYNKIRQETEKNIVEDAIALIEKNKEKAARKREKRGERAEKINEMAQMNTKSIKSSANRSTSSLSEKEKEERIARASQNIKEGSIAAKANMVKKFNENK